MPRLLFLFAFLAAAQPSEASGGKGKKALSREVIWIQGGRFTPLFGLDKSQKDALVAPFGIDRVPVSNLDFTRFLKANPEWLPGRVSPLFADSGYLQHWKDPKRGARYKKSLIPVTHVSWHAAGAYCEWKGGRLPEIIEWEFVAAADEKKPYALKDPEFNARILAWYSKPFRLEKLRPVGASPGNFYGVQDLHGGAWEWAFDFNSVFVTGDNRQDGDKNANFLCGAGSTDASNRDDYAAFMRYAMRSSLSAEYTTSSLGFRCAYDAPAKGQPHE